MDEKIKIVKVNIDQLKYAEYNPRLATDKEKEDLKKSLKKFGFVEPIVVNSSSERKNVIIGGHFRVRMAKEIGMKEVPVVYVNIAEIEKEKELNLRLNKNLGSWDIGLLELFDRDLLTCVGFMDDELSMLFDINNAEDIEVDENRLYVITVEAPEAPKLKERMSFYCDNISEYNIIKEYFGNGSKSLDKDKLLQIL